MTAKHCVVNDMLCELITAVLKTSGIFVHAAYTELMEMETIMPGRFEPLHLTSEVSTCQLKMGKELSV